MPRYVPPIPPEARQQMPDDPFELWLARQALAGHDRHWLRRNAVSLKERWEREPTADLPPPLPPRERVRDRYEEL